MAIRVSKNVAAERMLAKIRKWILDADEAALPADGAPFLRSLWKSANALPPGSVTEMDNIAETVGNYIAQHNALRSIRPVDKYHMQLDDILERTKDFENAQWYSDAVAKIRGQLPARENPYVPRTVHEAVSDMRGFGIRGDGRDMGRNYLEYHNAPMETGPHTYTLPEKNLILQQMMDAGRTDKMLGGTANELYIPQKPRKTTITVNETDGSTTTISKQEAKLGTSNP